MQSEFPLFNYSHTAIKYLYQDRGNFAEYPKCQRDYVWGKKLMREKLIDSILRQFPVPAILVIPGNETIIGRKQYIVDGQQRLRTIVDFMDGKFPTGDNKHTGRKSGEPGINFIESGKYYSELSPAMRERFDNYPFQICTVASVTEDMMGLIYRRINNQVSLSFAEQLWSFVGKAQPVYTDLADHSFWKSVYIGNRDRKQVFQSLLQCIRMELMDTFTNLTSPQLIDLASGGKDKDFPADLSQRIAKHLDACLHLYHGYQAKNMRALIPMYQSVLLLEQEGCNFSACKEGALTLWLTAIQQENIEYREKRLGDNNDLFGAMPRVNIQTKFWQEQWPNIRNLSGMVIKERKRAFSSYARLAAFNRQKGKCAICDKPIRMNDEAHHIRPYSEGGNGDPSNCQIVHHRCHVALHQPAQATLV